MSNPQKANIKGQYPVQNTDYELTELDDEIILFSVKQEKAIYLNPSAQLIWQLCDGKNSVMEIIAGLEQEYPKEASIEHDVLDALDTMLSDNAISLVSVAVA